MGIIDVFKKKDGAGTVEPSALPVQAGKAEAELTAEQVLALGIRVSSDRKDDEELYFPVDGGVEIMWGDMGVAGFFINYEDLKRKDFSKVLYNWDCG